MSNEPSARAVVPEPPSNDDYETLCAALSATERGRAFLAEYARRQRAAETVMLMAAIERLEALLRPHSLPPVAPASADAMRAELYALLTEIRAAQSQSDASGLAVQVARLAETIEQVERRLETMVAPADKRAHAETETANVASEPAEAADTAPIVEIVLPKPEVETASDTSTARHASLEAPQASAPPQVQVTAIPKVGWFDEPVAVAEQAAEPPVSPPPNPTAMLAIGAVVEAAAVAAAEPEAPTVTVFKAGTIPPPAPFAGEDFADDDFADAEPEASPPAADPLAAIKALSEEERLALFT